jgi:arylsulfate sulfotransferase
LKIHLATWGLLAGSLLTLGSLGCGSGISTVLPTVNATENPLVAQYTLQHLRPGLAAWVEFGPDTNYGRQTSSVTSSTTTVIIQVAGMKAETTYHMRAHVDTWVDDDRTFTTGPLPPQLTPPGITVTRPTPSLTPAPGVELFSLISGQAVMLQSIVTDLQGNIIWFYPAGAAPIKFLDNGDFILNLTVHLREIDLAGNTIRDVTLDQVNQSLQANGYLFSLTQFHHDILVLPNGHWIALGQINKDFTDLPGFPGTTSVEGDVLVDIDPMGNVAWAWSAFDHLDINRHLMGLPDWTHSNALVYTPEGNLLLSIRHQSWVIKIDYANGTGTGNVLWRLGQDGDFSLLGGDPGEWFYAQHDPSLISSNAGLLELAVWDNGDLRQVPGGLLCGEPSAPACYSRATTFQIDENSHIASLDWQFLPGLYSFWGGSIGLLSNGNMEFDVTTTTGGTMSQIMEVTHTDNPQTVWQLNLSGENAYRAGRIPSLYPGVTWTQ